MKIHNFPELARTELRKAALEIIEAGLQAIDTKKAIRDSIFLTGDTLQIKGKDFALSQYKDIYVVGVGKCAIDAAVALEKILGPRLADGLVIDVRDSQELKKIRVFRGFHPRPDEANVDATKELIKFLKARDKDDLVLCVVSGGGSTILCSPEDLSCQEEGLILDLLSRSAAPIKKINIVRKHISYARGGHLAKYAYPATVISLIFSDIATGELDVVASGPTFLDETTVRDAEAILMEYDILKQCGIKHCGLIETPKEAKYFEKVHNLLIVGNEVALQAMQKKAGELNYHAETKEHSLVGEAREVGQKILADLTKAKSKTSLLYGGETTVTVTGTGKGGRNQELALACVKEIKDGQVIAAVNTDGRDNSGAAGALCDISTQAAAAKRGASADEYLHNNDSYNFFKTIGDQIITGDTGSNVSDLIIAIKH